MSEGKNLLQRLNDIRAEVKYVQKDKTVAGFGYKAVTHDAITAHSREAFIKHGVICIPNLKESSVTPIKTKDGADIIRYAATYEFAFYNVDDPQGVHIAVLMEAHAIDSGDKAPGKALSYAKKYAILKLLEIETGEDEESRFGESLDGLSEEQKDAFTKAVAKVKNKEELADLWKEIVSACKDAGPDKQSYAHFKKAVQDRSKGLKDEK